MMEPHEHGKIPTRVLAFLLCSYYILGVFLFEGPVGVPLDFGISRYRGPLGTRDMQGL